MVEACNDPGNDEFGTYTDCPDNPELALGVITNNTYVPDPYTGDFVRFNPSSDGEKGGKGKSKGKDITRLSIYVGWVVDASLDSNGDGVTNEDDVGDLNGDGYTNADDVELWIEQQAFLGMAWYFSEQDNTWMHEIADLVITEQGLTNMGTKTLQVRFYPRSTTVFH